MFCDLHLHTDFSGDCDTPAELQIERAIALGMKEICFTDHHDYDVVSPTDFTLDIDRYLPFMAGLRDVYGDRIRIGTGIELGLQGHIKGYLDDLIRTHRFDFVIGSCHFIDGIDPYFPEFFEGRSEREGYERFFEVTLERLKLLDCFDSLGHLDYVVRYGPKRNREYSYEAYREWIDPILRLLVEKGIGLECNTGGFKYGLGHPNPCEEILTRYRELGGEILTIGSDAHKPEYVGYGFERLEKILTACGYRYYTVFHDRKPEFIKI